MVGRILNFINTFLLIIWCLLVARLLLMIVRLIRDRIREAIILKELKKNNNFNKLYGFAIKINLEVMASARDEYSAFAYSKTVKNLFGKEKEVALDKPFVVLGVKYRRSGDLMTISLSHEIGHNLYYLSQIDKYGAYSNSPDILCSVKNSKCELIGEIEAWEYALKLLKYLKIDFDREKFLKVASSYFNTYLIEKSNCLNQDCPKLLTILSNELTFGSLTLNQDEQKRVVDYFNGIAKTIQFPDLGRIFNN